MKLETHNFLCFQVSLPRETCVQPAVAKCHCYLELSKYSIFTAHWRTPQISRNPKPRFARATVTKDCLTQQNSNFPHPGERSPGSQHKMSAGSALREDSPGMYTALS